MNKGNFLYFCLLFILIFALNSFAELTKKELILYNSDSEIKKFNVEIADTDISRSKGFMWRKNIPNGTGMLFVWQNEAHRNFWMKNTPTSLDIIFFDKEGTFVNVVRNTKPFSLENINSIRPSKYVLELAAGSSFQFNIYKGSKILNLNK